MPDFSSRADGTVPPTGDSALDELLAADQSPQDAAAGLRPVAAVLAALRAGPAEGELTGQARALAEFRSTVRVSHRADRSRARRPAAFRARLSSKLAIITTAAAVAVTGTVAAAYAGVLPGPLQRAAHDVIAAPPAHGRPTPDTFGARPLHPRSAAPRALPTGSAAAPLGPGTPLPGMRQGPAGSARKNDQHKRHGHHRGHRSHRPAGRQSMPGHWHGAGPALRSSGNPMARHPGNRHSDGPAPRRNDNPIAHHKGSRLQSPLPKAAAFPSPPAGPDRPGAGGR